MAGKHALLSPSAAHRWMNCTAAPLLERDVEDKSSTFAEEGTLAHAYCAKKLKEFLGSNCTFMELKYRCKALLCSRRCVLIVPLWN